MPIVNVSRRIHRTLRGDCNPATQEQDRVQKPLDRTRVRDDVDCCNSGMLFCVLYRPLEHFLNLCVAFMSRICESAPRLYHRCTHVRGSAKILRERFCAVARRYGLSLRHPNHYR